MVFESSGDIAIKPNCFLHEDVAETVTMDLLYLCLVAVHNTYVRGITIGNNCIVSWRN